MLPLIVRRQLHAQLAQAVERRRPDDVRLSPLMFALPVLKSILPMPWRCHRGDPRRPRPPGRRGGANAGAGLDLARRLGRNDASDELAARTPRS